MNHARSLSTSRPAWVLAVWVALAALIAPLSPVFAQQPEPATGNAVTNEATANTAEAPQSVEDFAELQAKIEAVVQQVRTAVVCLRVGGSSGSGTIITADGWIVTCAHVTTEVEKDCVVILHDGRQLRGKTKGLHGAMDYALVKAETNGEELPCVDMGSNANLVPGQWVVAMGHPLGYQRSRPPVVRFGRVLSPMSNSRIVHDAPLISGDSGGPLFDLDGKIIGINVSIDGARAFINNASPIDEVTKNYESLQNSVALDGEGAIGDFDRQMTDALEKLAANEFEKATEVLGRMQRENRFADRKADIEFALARVNAAWAKAVADETESANRTRLAIEAVRSAVELGFENLHALLHAEELADLRDADPFKAAVASVRERIREGRAFVGIQGRDAEDGGVVITQVVSGAAAQAAGMRAGDILKKLGETDVTSIQQLVQVLNNYRPGDEATFEFVRDGETITATIILGKRQEEAAPEPGPAGQRRTRITEANMRANATIRNVLQDTIAPARRSVVKVHLGTSQAAFGTIVDARGYIATKLSELKGAEIVGVELPGGKRVPAQVVGTDETLDLALLRVTERDLPAVTWYDGDARGRDIGEMVAVAGSNPVPEALGILSLDNYASRDASRRPFVGITGADLDAEKSEQHGVTGGFTVESVVEGTGAHAAGLQAGDVVIAIDGQAIEGMGSLHDILDGKKVGDDIEFLLIRGDEKRTLKITLGKRPSEGGGDQRQGIDRSAMLAGPRNERRTGFGPVVQTDATIAPNQVGSLLVDLHGNVLGMTIARFDRTITFAIPADVMKATVAKLIEKAEEDF